MYLHNAHNAPNVLNSLESFLVEKPNPEGFRLWVACQADPEVIPVRLLQNSIKAVVDTPKVQLPKVLRNQLIMIFVNFQKFLILIEPKDTININYDKYDTLVYFLFMEINFRLFLQNSEF